jgi:hypothetical protein
MKGIRFYLEYTTPADKNRATRKEPGNHEGNVFAAFVENGVFYGGDTWAQYEGLGAVYFHPNSAVASTSAPLSYLSTYCLRISECQAREIHPRLFEWLDDPQGED